MIRIGTAGWNIPRQNGDQFPVTGTTIERYSAVFPVTEVNSSFHGAHRLSTWARWRDSVPEAFRFSVKLPKQITHLKKLVDCSNAVERFIDEIGTLGEKLEVLLVQLPPKLEFDRRIARSFFLELGARTPASLACEPRHPSWFTREADELLTCLRVARVAADPAICEEAARPGGWAGLSYTRLHGSPLVYRSSYKDRIASYARRLEREAERCATWCIFDNTASSAATGDALALVAAIRPQGPR